jgi:prophage DNA circulation protein
MTWRDELSLNGKGSFRGEEFYVSDVGSTIGRRTATYEFPGRDKPMIEDLGRKMRSFNLTCYVIGPDYMRDRDKLRIAFEKPGPGPFVHPYFGEMTASVDGDVTLTETTAEGGMCRFNLRLIEFGGEEKAPTVEPDTQTEVDKKADAAIEAASNDFEEEWTLAGAIADAVQAAIDAVNSVVSTMNAIKGRVNAVMNTIDSIGDAINSFASTVSAIIALPGQIASSISELVTDIYAAIDTIGDSWDSYFAEDETSGEVAGTPLTSPSAATPASGSTRIEVLMDAFRSFMEYGDDFSEVTGTTSQKQIQATNQDAIIILVKTIAVAEACRVAAYAPFSNYDQAVSVRDELIEEIDALIENAGDETYAALMDLRASISKHLISVAADLPMITEYTPTKSMPALVISQIIYGDSKHETEIIARNNLRNPAIVEAGTALEVLSDD